MKRRCLVFLLSALAAGCSGTTPGGPSPFGTPDPGPVVTNTPPVIGALSVQGTRTNEPPNFADASEEVPITVAVTDAESQITDLKFIWTSSAGGTFAGSGAKVIWKAPDKVDVPTSVTLTVEVVETYTSQGKQLTNNPKGSVTLSLHDSVKEVGDMAVQFLKDFSDTSIKDVPYIMRNFEPGCPGTDLETTQTVNHIADFDVLSYQAGQAATTVHFGEVCPYNGIPGDACAQVRMHWESRAKHNLYWWWGDLYKAAGELDIQDGVDQVAARYFKDKQRWRLCDSSWDSDNSHTLKATTPRSLVFPSSVP